MFAGFRQLGWSVVCLEAVSAARGAAAGIFKIADAVRTNIRCMFFFLCIFTLSTMYVLTHFNKH